MFRFIALSACVSCILLCISSAAADRQTLSAPPCTSTNYSVGCEQRDKDSCGKDPSCDVYGDKCAPRCKVFNADSAACNKTVFCNWTGNACAIDCSTATCNATCTSGAYAAACYWHNASSQCKQARSGNGNAPFLSTTDVATTTVTVSSTVTASSSCAAPSHDSGNHNGWKLTKP